MVYNVSKHFGCSNNPFQLFAFHFVAATTISVFCFSFPAILQSSSNKPSGYC